MSNDTNAIRNRIKALEDELATLKTTLHSTDAQPQSLTSIPPIHDNISPIVNRPLPARDYELYARQIILPQIGVHGQSRLRNARVAIVGVGGLGCPAATYLAGAGVGSITLIDGDTVDVSNLHRQIIHSRLTLGMSKVDSAVKYLTALNPDVNYIAHPKHLTPQSAPSIFADNDIVLDCTDHPAARYLISDACVLAAKPLVSASALATEGQMMVLNAPTSPTTDLNGPCYRCIFPTPPPPEAVTTCGEGGILGPVVGIMGVLQALEAIKLLTTDNYNSSPITPTPTMLMFSAYNTPQFRQVKLRPPRSDCDVCSISPKITKADLMSGAIDYAAFCGAAQPVDILPDDLRISAADLSKQLNASKSDSAVLIDVRDSTQFELCNIPGSINIPWRTFHKSLEPGNECDELLKRSGHIAVICKLGNDSQLAVKMLRDAAPNSKATIRDVKNGFAAWKKEVDPSWPDY